MLFMLYAFMGRSPCRSLHSIDDLIKMENQAPISLASMSPRENTNRHFIGVGFLHQVHILDPDGFIKAY